MTSHVSDIAPASGALYPGRSPVQSGHLGVSSLHSVYWEESGNPKGLPVVCLHGGPGGGGDSHMRRYFDPDRYRIVIFDQRGSGRSTPHSELRGNTTWDLVADMESLREHLGIDSWVLFGGSWGTTLALTYAATHKDRVAGLILRGVFLLTRTELDWFYQRGANQLFPDAYEEFVRVIPDREHHDIIGAFHRRLTGEDKAVRLAAARAWSRWEMETVSLLGSRAADLDRADFVDAFARIECHYFANRGFFERDGWLLDQDYSGLEGIIIHGRHDVVTPVWSSWQLVRRWQQADLRIVPGAGHSGQDPGIVAELVRATDQMCSRLT